MLVNKYLYVQYNTPRRLKQKQRQFLTETIGTSDAQWKK